MDDERYLQPQSIGELDEASKHAVHTAIALRRDIRHFQADRDVPAALLERVLLAAHRAPSVGLSQPWGFVIIRDHAQRTRVRDSFLACRAREAERFEPARRQAYLAHQLEGILEAPLNLCVVADLRPRNEPVLGTTAQPESLLMSVGCAVQNLWLAARVEGIGVGWVSIVEPAVIRRELALPDGVQPVAYLCIGYPRAFRDTPMLEETGWRERRALDHALHPDGVWRDRR